MKSLFPSAVAAALILAAAGAAVAQPPGPPPGEARHGWDGAAMHERMQARHAERIKALHDLLAITPDQEGAFQTFAAALDAPMDEGRPPRDRPDDMRRLTLPERLDAMKARMDAREARLNAAFERKAAAAKAFYAVLTPTQRKAMDALPVLMGPGGGMGPEHGMGEHGWGHHGMGKDWGGHGPDSGEGPPPPR